MTKPLFDSIHTPRDCPGHRYGTYQHDHGETLACVHCGRLFGRAKHPQQGGRKITTLELVDSPAG